MSKSQIAGWVLSVLLAAFLTFASALGKFTEWEGKAEMLEHVGYSNDVLFRIGVVEVACAILFLIPQTAFVGSILLTGYLGGAVATHVRLGDSFVVPIVIGVVIWIALGLRNQTIFRLAMGGSPLESKSTDDTAQ